MIVEPAEIGFDVVEDGLSGVVRGIDNGGFLAFDDG